MRTPGFFRNQFLMAFSRLEDIKVVLWFLFYLHRPTKATIAIQSGVGSWQHPKRSRMKVWIMISNQSEWRNSKGGTLFSLKWQCPRITGALWSQKNQLPLHRWWTELAKNVKNNIWGPVFMQNDHGPFKPTSSPSVFVQMHSQGAGNSTIFD